MKKRNNERKVPADRHPLHPEKKLVTRRDFLSTGAIGFSGMVALPSVLEMALFTRAARAGVVSGTPSLPPLLIIDCAGGAALPGNWPPMDQSGQPLASYSDVGLQTVNSWTLDNRFGAPMAGPLPAPNTTTVQSNIFAALTTGGMTPAIQNCIQMGIIPVNSSSDSQSNQLSPISLVTAAGSVGTMVNNGLGMSAAVSGGNSDWGSGNPTNKPMEILSVDSLAAALSYGPAFQSLPVGVLDSLANALINLSGTQAQNFNNMSLGQQFNQVVQAGYMKNAGYTAGVTGIDPRVDTDAARIYGLTTGTASNSQNVVFGTIALNAILGNSGPGVITIGGCDYHDGTQTTGDTKDTQIGTAIANAIQLAYAKGKMLTVIVITDGGIYSDANTRNWRGDDNQHGLAAFIVMDPNGKPTMAQTQVGSYNSGQVTDPNFTVGNNPLMVSHALFLNYLSAAGQVGNFGSIIQSQDPTNAALLSTVYGSTSAMVNALSFYQGNYSGS